MVFDIFSLKHLSPLNLSSMVIKLCNETKEFMSYFFALLFVTLGLSHIIPNLLDIKRFLNLFSEMIKP